MKLKLLIIEDNNEIVEAISIAFRLKWPGDEVLANHLGEPGIDLIRREKPDVVILDLGLPDISGFEVLRQARQFSDVPIIVLTVRTEEMAVVRSLEYGADEYLYKPFRQLELMARIEAMLRRQRVRSFFQPQTCGPYTLDPHTRQLTWDGRETKLTAIEVRILGILISRVNQPVSHSELTNYVWGNTSKSSLRNLMVCIRRLRKKVEKDPADPKLIRTRSGEGYYFSLPEVKSN